jgi:hypothetical protein
MSVKPSIAIIAFTALLFFGLEPYVMAQTAPAAAPGSPPRYVRRPIEIHPRPLLYRRCADWYELQNRPSGTVLYPQMRCWWVRG